MTENYKEILSRGLYNVVADFISSQEDCCIVVENHNNWDNDLPERLQSQKQFILNINKQTLEDSYIDGNNKIVICTTFDDNEYSKVFEPCDISALLANDGKTPLMIKPFKEEPEIPEVTFDSKFKHTEPDIEGIANSMEAFRKNNPEMF